MTSDLDIAKAAIAAGFPALQTPTAVAVALAASGGNAGKDAAGRRGLWQLKADDVGEDWADPTANAKAAKTVFDRDGWNYWPEWRNNTYLIQMPRGAAAAAAATAINTPGNIIESLPNPLEPLQDLANETRRGVAVLTDRDTWIRAGLYLLGGLIIAFAVTGLLLALTGKSIGSVTRVVLGSKVKAVKQTTKGT